MEISWTVYQMHRHASHEGKEGVIYELHWDCIAKQDGHNHRINGCTTLDITDLNNFTNFSEVTEEQVMEWLMSAVDVETEEARCRAGLEKKLNPPTLKGLPWGDTSGEEEEG